MSMTGFPAPEMVATNGIRLAVYRGGPAPVDSSLPTIVCLHGWPELAYSWRYQLQAFAAAGHPVLVPDQRGYGQSDKPQGVDSYTAGKLIGDLAGMLDHYGVEKAVFVGHDWGALLLWQLPWYIPDRLLGLAGLNVAFWAPGPIAPIPLFRQAFGPDMYIVRFQTEGACEPILEADLNRTMRCFLRRPILDRTGPPPAVPDHIAAMRKKLDLIGLLQEDERYWSGETFLPDEDHAVYERAFASGGFTAPLHWYRNFDSNHAELRRRLDGAEPRIEVPCLMLTADRDAACPPHLANSMPRFIPDLERHDLTDVGHWLQQERPDDVNRLILDWVGRRFD